MVKNYDFTVQTKGFTDIVNISLKVFEFIECSEIHNGNVLVFSPGSTSGITTIEYESGCIEDLKRFYERIAPSNIDYEHNKTWGDGNGYSHIRAAITKSSFSFPFIDGKPMLGTWQQLILIDFDNRSRNRKVYVQIVGE